MQSNSIVFRACKFCGTPLPANRTKFCNMRCKAGPRKPIADRFWSKVGKTDGCWLWSGRKAAFGYGSIHMPDGQPRLAAHRVSWELHYGPIPEGMHVLHRCDNPPCVNPEHLFLGTQADNNRDKKAKGRSAKGAGHGLAKLTEAQVFEIRRLHSKGLGCCEIARRIGCSPSMASFICRRKNWTHI